MKGSNFHDCVDDPKTIIDAYAYISEHNNDWIHETWDTAYNSFTANQRQNM